MVKEFSKKFLLITVILLSLLFTSTTQAQNGIRFPVGEVTPTISKEPSITVNPAYFIQDKTNTENFTSKLTIQYANTDPDKITNKFWEYDSEYKNRTESKLLKEIINLKSSGSGVERTYVIEIDTKSLKDQTYFFGVEFNVNSDQETSSIQPNFGVNIPIILTINSSKESVNPKPEFGLITNKRYFFSQEDIVISSQVLNNSGKLINFAGEIIVIDDKNEQVYSKKIPTVNERLLPNESITTPAIIDNLKGQGAFPYVGRLRVFLRGTVNNQRNIETKPIELYVIPYQLIIAFTIFIALFGFLVNYFLKKKSKQIKNS